MIRREDDHAGFVELLLPAQPSYVGLARTILEEKMHLIRSLMDVVECQSSPLGTILREEL